MTSESMGDFLRRRRTELGLSGQAVAAAVERSQVWYSNIERGTLRLQPKYFERLAEVLRLDYHELVDRVLGLSNATELAIVKDDLLTSIRDRRLILLVYGELTGRDSVRALSLYGDSSSD